MLDCNAIRPLRCIAPSHVSLLLLLLSTVVAENSGSKWVWGGQPRTVNDNNRAESIRDRDGEEFTPSKRPLFKQADDYQEGDGPNYRPPSRISEVDNLNRYRPQIESRPPRRYNNNDDYPRPTGSNYPQRPGRYDETRPSGSGGRYEPNTRPNGRYDDQYPRPPGRNDQYPRPGGEYDRPLPYPQPSRPGGFGLGSINGPEADFGPEPYPRPRPGPLGPGPGDFGPIRPGGGPFRPGGPGPLGPGPSGNGGGPAILTGPVPSWEQGRGDGVLPHYDRCKCALAFNCISPGIQFGQCDAGGKMYCCHNSIHEGGKNIDGPGQGGGGGGIGPGFNGPRPYDRPYDRPIPSGGPIGINGYGGNRPVLSGPNPTGILSEGGGRPTHPGQNYAGDRQVLSGPNPTGILSEGPGRPIQLGPGYGNNRPGLNGYDGNRPVLSGPRPTGILTEGGGRPIGGNNYNRPIGNDYRPVNNLNGNQLILSGPRPTGILSEGSPGGRPGRPLGSYGVNGGGFGGNREERPFNDYDDDRVRRYADGIFQVDKYEPEGLARTAGAKEEEEEKKT